MLLIPVLFQGAAMPGTEQLPPSLAGLTRRNAFEIRNSSWRYDVDRLIRALEDGGGTKAGVRPAPADRAVELVTGEPSGSPSLRRSSRRSCSAPSPPASPDGGIGRHGHQRPDRGRRRSSSLSKRTSTT